ncbi:major facilitator superfamily domain-containing protein, partial [Dimargaris cristalligena]
LYITVVGVILAMFPATLDETIIATSMNVIASEFNSQADVTWLATSYLLTMTAFSPIYGKLSDIFGLRLTMLTSIFTFMVASLLGALSPGMVYLIVFRAISGVAAAGLTSLALIAISKITPEESRGKYLGYLGVLYAVTGVLGPVIGGILTDKASWRWNFYLNIPLCVVAFAIIYFVLRVPVPRGSYWSKLKRVDYVGIVLFIGAVVIFLLALQWGGKDYAWDSATIIGLLVGSAALMAIFIWYELRWTPEPTFELHLAKVRNVWVSCLLGFTIGWVLLVIIYYIPLYYQYVHQYTAMPAGLQLLPFLIPLNVIAIAAGFITERWGCYKLVSVLGLALSALGTGLFYLISAEVSVAVVGVALGFAGLGVGLSIQMSIIPAQQQVGFALISQVTSFISFTRLIGGVFGISVVGAIINNTLESQAQTIM